ncbi:MAG: DUF4239 domain-containing protein [Hyphomicrobiales bacterium]
MIDGLYNLSLRLPDLLILLLCALSFGGLGVLVARLSHRLWWSRVREEGERDAGEGVHNSILALIAFLLALITTSELAAFANADRNITQESLAIRRLDRDLASLGEDGRAAQALLASYVKSVAVDEWPRLSRRPQSLSPVADQYMTRLWDEVRRLQPRAAATNSSLGSDLNDSLRKIEDGRINRLAASVNGIPDVVWLMIGLFFFSACVLAGRHRLTRYAMQVVFIQMSALGVILALDIIIDNPFGGDTSLGPERIIAALDGKV